MIPLIFDLINDSNEANKQFALDLYLPDFPKNKPKQDIEKSIKVAEVRKQLKKIRTHLMMPESLKTNEPPHLNLLLAIIVSSLVDSGIHLSVFAKKEATSWQGLKIEADLYQIETISEKEVDKFIKAAANLGHFHSKPFNTLSSIQFCRDENYIATGEYGFTENQLSDTTASLSISGGSNAYSAFYAILISRINTLSIAEHLIQKTVISLAIQSFFKRFLTNDSLELLQQTIKTSLTTTAENIGDELHIMDKQITLPCINENGECEYLNITPIVNPTVFAATSRSIFYIKNQITDAINISLGGANPSNAGTAVGEVAGQNARLKMSFPSSNKIYVKQVIFSLNKQGGYFWSAKLKKQLGSNLLQYANNSDLSNEKKKKILEKTVEISLFKVIEQFEEISLYLQTVDKEKYPSIMGKEYSDFFSEKKITAESYNVWLEALIYSFESLKEIEDNEVDRMAVIREIKRQFSQQIHLHGGL